MNGSEPPSSSTHFLSDMPAADATATPARSLPVSVTAAMRSSEIRSSAISFSMSSVENNPSGAPAWVKMRSISSAQRVVLSACFNTTAFPAISAGAAARKTCQYGKFHGMMAKMTPSGRKAIALRDALLSTERSASSAAA